MLLQFSLQHVSESLGTTHPLKQNSIRSRAHCIASALSLDLNNSNSAFLHCQYSPNSSSRDDDDNQDTEKYPGMLVFIFGSTV